MAKDQEIYQYLVGTTDDGDSINFNVETKHGVLDTNFENIIYPVELIVEVEEGNNIQMMIALDNGPYFSVGRVKRGIQRLPIDLNVGTGEVPRCRQISIAYREMSESRVIIGRLAINYYVANEVESEAAEVLPPPTGRAYN